ncbi:ABC transporter substrate-binding protein [Chelativorans sp. M5D2P16]|uniref:ABC transporter substrate-binding protein n=1 Tax=Chelativorans sp. M5D2P16 TaxID=3095678 RepID=UPI002AC9F2CB|nr:ABC transporter substrate-binding protein [Chelativorans sp. M5D2P16]MDZ5696546.1 ABC transporter substrate-binding protein [Chelativorans sp. M5D2P16]
MTGKLGMNRRGATAPAVTRRTMIAALGGMSLAACALTGLAPAAKAQNAEPVKVGVMGPFTGPASRTGEGIQKGARMALEDARADGMLPVTIDGEERDIEFVWVDSQSSPEKAVKAVSDAVSRQGVQIMVSGWHSSVAMAVSEAEIGMDIVHIGHGGESQFICEKINQDPENYRHWFKGWSSPPIFAGLYGEPLQHFMDEGLWQPENMKAAVVVEDTDYGRGWGEALANSLEKVGFDVLPYDVIPLDETEFTPLLAKYRAQNVSVVGMTVTGNVSASNFVKQFHQQQLPALLIGHGLTWFSEWHELTGEASNYVITMDSPRVIAPYQQEWVERYREKYDEDPSFAPAGQQGYDYMMTAIKVLQNAGTLDFETLVEEARAIDHQGVWQRINFAEEAGESALCPGEVQVGGFEEGFFFPLVQLIDGEAKILWPLEHAQAEFQAPPWLQ